MKRIEFWLAVLCFLGSKCVLAQVLYPSSQHLGLQTATLENVMLLQNLRDPQNDCIGRNAWALGYGLGGVSRGEVEVKENGASEVLDSKFHDTLGGFLVGADTNLGTTSRLGGFFAFNTASQTDQTSEKVETTNGFWGVYGKKDWENAYFLGTGAIGFTHTEDDLKANAFRGFAYGETGLNFLFGAVDFQPFWGLQYYYAGNGSAEGEMADGATQVSASPLKTNSLRNVVGARLGVPLYVFENQKLSVNCLGFWFHEFLNDSDLGGGTINLQPEGGALVQYVVGQQKNGRDWCVLAPTFDWKRGNLHLWAGYIALFNESEVLHLGQGGLGFCW